MGVSQGAPDQRRRNISAGTPVVVIGQDVADHFFPNLDPIGRELRIQSIPYTVVGVAEKQGSAFGISLDKFLIAPEQVAAQPLGQSARRDRRDDHPGAERRVGMREAMEAARAVMRARHHLHPSQPDNFELETSDSALEFWNKLKGYLVIAGIALPDGRARRRRDRDHEHHARRRRRAHARDRHSQVARRAPQATS